MSFQDWDSAETSMNTSTGTIAGVGAIAAMGGGFWFLSSAWDKCIEPGRSEQSATARQSSKDFITMAKDTVTQNPQMAAVGTGVAVTFLSISGSSSDGGDDIGDIIIFWKKNQMPYSRIERNAQRIFDKYHRKKNFKMNFPVVIASSKESMNYADKLFSSESVDDSLENIEVIERLINESINN